MNSILVSLSTLVPISLSASIYIIKKVLLSSKLVSISLLKVGSLTHVSLPQTKSPTSSIDENLFDSL